MTNTDDDLDLSPWESLLFWITLALAVFGFCGFVAGIAYGLA